jgi:hypothetical protein
MATPKMAMEGMIMNVGLIKYKGLIESLRRHSPAGFGEVMLKPR